MAAHRKSDRRRDDLFGADFVNVHLSRYHLLATVGKLDNFLFEIGLSFAFRDE